MKVRLIVLTLMIFVAGCFVGCTGSNKIHTDMVTGTVTDVDGSPLVGATVNFSPDPAGQGNAAYAITDESGHYKLQTLLGNPDAGTTPGTYKVAITKAILVPTGKKETRGDGSVVDEMLSKELLPAAYTSVTTTPFKETVVKGKNTFDFTLKADGT